MAKVAEGMSRVASEIAAGRLARSDFATKIKVATSSRRSDIESFLRNMNSVRGKATRERTQQGQKTVSARHKDVLSMLLDTQTSRLRAGSQQAAEAERAAAELHNEVRSMLDGQKASRSRAARESRKDAAETISRRQADNKAMLDQFARERASRQRHRRELAGLQHKQAAAFMRDLTNGVDAFRDKLAKDGRDRAAEIRDSLSACAHDRRDGMAIWRGNFQKSHPAKEKSGGEAVRGAVVQSTAAPAPRHEPAAAPSAPVVTNAATGFAKVKAHTDEAKSTKPAPGRQPTRHTGRGSPLGRRGGHSK
jgi:hypothetical protein